jgi:diguanylate cyclase (GGDEF)-like protein
MRPYEFDMCGCIAAKGFPTMDALTAGTALIAVQLCIAAIMAGTFFATPQETCTRYWAQSGLVTALGVLMVVINAGRPNYFLLIVGNNSLIAGLVLQWWGVQAFYKKPPGRWGWAVLAGFFVCYGMLLIAHAAIADRAALSAITIMLVFSLNFIDLWKNSVSRRSFANVMGMFGLTLLITSSAFRAVMSLQHNETYLPTSASSLGVGVVYLVPLVGTLLFSVALLLLYFERIVKSKHYLATHDELTGLLNRRAVIAGGEREIAVASRLHQPLVVAYIDVDHFKKINDDCGHDTGDKVLAEIANVLQQTCRKIDLVGRYGGEEFCAVFPGIDGAAAMAVGERLVAAVREHAFLERLPVTVSVGLAVLRPDETVRTWKHLIGSADRALYRAKEGGRNCFRVEHEAVVTDLKSGQIR